MDYLGGRERESENIFVTSFVLDVWTQNRATAGGAHWAHGNKVQLDVSKLVLRAASLVIAIAKLIMANTFMIIIFHR